MPGTRRVPAYTFMEDLLESRYYQWNPAVQRGRHTTRATVDAQSLQRRLAEQAVADSNATTASTSVATVGALSNGTNNEADVSCI